MSYEDLVWFVGSLVVLVVLVLAVQGWEARRK